MSNMDDWITLGVQTAATQWWLETRRHHGVELGHRVDELIKQGVKAANGCIELGSPDCPARLQWRKRRLRVYELVAWSEANEVPTLGQVVRHLCNNRACINPEHLAIGTQAQNLFDERQAKSKRHKWSHP